VPRNRTFTAALGVSMLIHLSMVSLFSIVIFFPRNDVDYYLFQIVPTTANTAPNTPVTVKRAADDPFTNTGSTTDEWAAYPTIELPTLEFAELKRLRFRQESLRVGERYERLFQETPRDSWARFGAELRSLSEALARLAPSWRAAEEETRPKRQPVGRHSAGFEFYIEWMSEPRDRQPIIAPPMDVLWNASASQVVLPINMIVNVDPQGKVIEVQTALPDDAGIVNGVGRVLRSYRFEPLADGETGNQRGVFIVVEAQKEL